MNNQQEDIIVDENNISQQLVDEFINDNVIEIYEL